MIINNRNKPNTISFGLGRTEIEVPINTKMYVFSNNIHNSKIYKYQGSNINNIITQNIHNTFFDAINNQNINNFFTDLSGDKIFNSNEIIVKI